MLQECLQVGHGLILYRTVLAVVLMVEIYLSEHIYPILAIVGTQLYLWTVEIVTQVAFVRECRIQSQTFALQFLGSDTHHGTYLRIVLGTWVVNHLYIANVLAA